MSNKPVIVRLMGGLGNQLFQYAMGRCLADQRGTELILDPRYVLRKGFVSGLAIELFNIRGQFITEAMGADYPEWKWKLSRAIRQRIRPCMGFYHETGYAYEPGLASNVDGEVMSGFWQSYKYFHMDKVLQADLTPKQALQGKAVEVAKRIKACNSVAIHLRRGDYVNNAKALAKHGLCSLDYYQAAVSEFQADNVSFFVFTDDPQWVKDNLELENAQFVSDEGFAQEVDFQLISLCKHQIIANSSFSWWAAHLNTNPTKKVIAPVPWFDDTSLDEKDLCPPEWVRLAK